MFAHLTAFELLLWVLVNGLIAALFGWAGGAGAARALRMKVQLLADHIDGLATLTNRFKGMAGQAKLKEQRGKLSAAEAEAEQLAQKLARAGGRGGLGGFLRRAPDPHDEEAHLDAANEEARSRGLVMQPKAAK